VIVYTVLLTSGYMMAYKSLPFGEDSHKSKMATKSKAQSTDDSIMGVS
jgi:hypothetical protein